MSKTGRASIDRTWAKVLKSLPLKILQPSGNLRSHEKPVDTLRMSARSNSARVGGKLRGIAPGRSAEHAGIWAGTVAAADEIGGRYCEDAMSPKASKTQATTVG